MEKTPVKKNETSKEFKAFKELAAKLLAIPKKEVDEKLKAGKKRKTKQKKGGK